MGGKASIIMVVSFMVIFGYINFHLADLTKHAAENMVGYNEIALSRNMASAGANIGLAMLTYKSFPHNNRVISQNTYTKGPFKGCSYNVRIDSFNTGTAQYLRMLCVSQCTTSFYKNIARTDQVIIQDTVEVRFDYQHDVSFSSYGWLSDQEGNVFFITGDTLWGKIHSNDNIHIQGSPVFWNNVTTSGQFDPRRNSGKFYGNKQTGVQEIPFPTDLDMLSPSATNETSTKSSEIYVEIKPGASGDNDGYAIISTGGFIGGTGVTQKDSMALSDFGNTVIFSTQNIHVKGKLDGRLTIGSNQNIILDGGVLYERPPGASGTKWDDAVNTTKDMLGLVALNNVVIPNTYPDADISIDAAIYAGNSFQSDNYNKDLGYPAKRINLRGSICQKERGAVGQTNGNGYKKSYHFDPRFANEIDPAYHPPFFPSYPGASTLHVQNWWESPRVPLNASDYF